MAGIGAQQPTAERRVAQGANGKFLYCGVHEKDLLSVQFTNYISLSKKSAEQTLFRKQAVCVIMVREDGYKS